MGMISVQNELEWTSFLKKLQPLGKSFTMATMSNISLHDSVDFQLPIQLQVWERTA